MVATIVDTTALLESVLAALVAGVGVTLIFSLAILGNARFTELNRSGRSVAALAFGTMGVLALVAFVAAITIGIIVMTQS
jgi:hypothetical protein